MKITIHAQQYTSHVNNFLRWSYRRHAEGARENLHKVARTGRFYHEGVEQSIITHAHGVAQSGAMQVRVIPVDFRLSPSVRRLARNFARLTGVPLARLLEPDLESRHGAD